MPVPPALGLVEGTSLRLVDGRLADELVLRVVFGTRRGAFMERDLTRTLAGAGRFFLPRALALAVFRLVARRALAARVRLALFRVDARAPAPVRLFDAVRFCRLLEPFGEEPAALRFAAFLAMVLDPCLSMARGARPRERAH